jgi:hypothetical protein
VGRDGGCGALTADGAPPLGVAAARRGGGCSVQVGSRRRNSTCGCRERRPAMRPADMCTR